VEELGRLLRSSNAGLALAAQQALELLRDDDSKRVSAAATAALATQATSQQSVAKTREERKAKEDQERTAEQQAKAEKAREEQERKAREEQERKARPTIASGGGEPRADDSGLESFWTSRRILAALTGFVGAVTALIVMLNTVGMKGRDDGTPSPTTSVTPAVDEAVLKGEYTVAVEVTALSGEDFLEENYVWAFKDPQQGDSDTETWTLNSQCAQEACDTSWGPASDNLSTKFKTLERDGGTYRETITGRVHCIPAANVERSIELNVTNAARVDRVWTVTRFAGTIKIDWVCNGHAVSAVLDLDATRSQT
jgi:hypothetical protein